jgi:hypothetical protein
MELRLDIRLPLGLLFLIFGAVLAIFGLAGDPAIYERSLGINVNLWWGTVLLGFGLLMFLLGRRSHRRMSEGVGSPAVEAKAESSAAKQ